ncbi:hypothetical protein IQ241_15720 [Romeria aff. gracilis LEGE 07310]|uniref:Phasin family protein n=1 Tax=Vasconcelosia minhoensis LEGE 07310 TaxID=915328 RepID=A0A8J7DMH0_9CYAN|nr:hypothetical protein [Romeria gracilis]MBE9078726.1 hypothetical protein [Romeria aff. gracilis LEGE 07310]
MADFSNLVQKAFYLGMGLASYAGEKAGSRLADLQGQAQKLVDELVERGEMTAEEAQKMINDMVERAQASAPREPAATEQPRRIEILDDDAPLANAPLTEPTPTPEEQQAAVLRREVESLRQELQRLKRE